MSVSVVKSILQLAKWWTTENDWSSSILWFLFRITHPHLDGLPHSLYRYLFKFAGDRGRIAPVHWDLETSNVLTSLCRIYTTEVALRCRTYVSRSVHRGTAASSTTPGLILPVHIWALGRKMISPTHLYLIPDVFNFLSSRANLHLSHNPAGRSHCKLQIHHGYIKHHHVDMGGSPGVVGEVPMT